MARTAWPRLLLALSLTACSAAVDPDEEPEPADTPPASERDARAPSTDAGASAAADTAGPSPGDAGTPPGADARPADAAPAAGPVIAEQKQVAVFWIEVDKKPIVADVKTPGRLKVFEEPGDSHDGLATRTPTAMLPVGISLRGNYSRGLPKKPYSLELQDGAGNEKPAALLGLPPEADWVLNASYTYHTFLRNPLTDALMQEMGRYASRFRFVEIYIDGAYQGLYILLEKPNRDRYRVNIPKPAATAAEGDLTGGYIFRLE